MNSFNTYLKIMLITAGCLFAAGLYAAEEGMAEEEAISGEEGMTGDAGTTAAEEGMAGEEGMAEEEGMLEEEAVELPPLYTSEVELGIGYSSVDSFKFGEYNGLEDEGPFAIANIKLRKYSVLGDDDNNYWEFIGTNLGLDPRNVYAEYSHDGTYGEYSNNNAYRFFFEYDQIPHNQFEDGRTPFNGAGTTNQTLPAGWVGASNTAGLTRLIPSLKNVELDTERYRLGGGFKWHFTDHWQAEAKYRHEIKDGSDPIGAVFGSSGGNPRTSILAFPINYDTDEFDASIAYTGDKAQYSLNYHLSLFDNNDTAVLWDNPFNNGSWDPGANFSDGARGRDSLFPDNTAHQVQFSGGYNFTPKTRAVATVSYSRWLQDANFLPFSNVFPANVLPLPRSSLDGDIETIFTNFNIYSRLTDRMDVKGRYTFENRNNYTPHDVYLRIPGDAVAQDDPSPASPFTSEDAIINRTYDLSRHLLELDGGYRFTPMMTKLELGYAYEWKQRNVSEVAITREHTGKVRLSATPFDTVSTWIKYQHSNLDGSDYISNRPLLSHHTPEHIEDAVVNACGGVSVDCPELYENNPFIRKYYFANRDRDRIQAAVNFYPNEKVDFTLNGEFRNDDYGDTELGLQESTHYNLTLDAGYHPNDIFNAYAFYTHEYFQYDQKGFRRNNDVVPDGGIGGIYDLAGAGADFWKTATEDKTNMFGAGLDWFVIEDKFKVNLDFTYSRTFTRYDQTNGPLLTGGNAAQQLPDVTTRLINLSLTGEYKFKENMKARFGYMYERYNTHDFGLDKVQVNSLSNVILLGNSSPDYVAHVIGVSFVYEFQ